MTRFDEENHPVSDYMRSLNRLAKWRSVFAGWQLGTRPDTDPECRAVRDHREATLLQRAELSALVGLLVTKGVFSIEEWTDALGAEAGLLNEDLARRFPGFRATDDGMDMQMPEAAETMKGWRP
jgi:hypothetical protein